MIKRSIITAGLLAGTAMRMTPAEQRAGRFLRSPDGHDAGTAPAPAPAEAASEAPAAPAQPKPNGTGVVNNTDDAYDKEFGDVTLLDDSSDDGDPQQEEKPAGEEPGVSEEEQKGDELDLAAELEAERQKSNRLESELLEAKKGKEPPKDDTKPAASEESDPAPKPDDYEFGEADSQFQADWARWNARQEFRAERAREQLTTELNAIENGWKTNVAAEDVTAEYPDFEQVVTEGAKNESWECTPLMALAIKSSPVGPHVAYELAKNPAEASRIAKLIPVEQAFELGKLEGKHAARVAGKKAAAEEKAPNPAKVVSSAPPPPQNRSRGSGGQYVSELSAVQDRMLKEFR